jgi:hypothetical protein
MAMQRPRERPVEGGDRDELVGLDAEDAGRAGGCVDCASRSALEDWVRAAVAVRALVAGGQVRGAVGCDLPDRPAAGAACDVDVPLGVDRDVDRSR